MSLLEFEEWDLDIFPNSEIHKSSWSIHSEWAHIKINFLETCRVERCGTPIDFLWAGCWDSAAMDLPNGPPELFIHPWGAIVSPSPAVSRSVKRPSLSPRKQYLVTSVQGQTWLILQCRQKVVGPADLWHGPAWKILTRKNVGTAQHREYWYEKILARRGTNTFDYGQHVFGSLHQHICGCFHMCPIYSSSHSHKYLKYTWTEISKT